jgi:hypothetical protein
MVTLNGFHGITHNASVRGRQVVGRPDQRPESLLQESEIPKYLCSQKRDFL